MISAVVICKNEEVNIGRCLRSIEDVVDEIIVVDSGSEDKTQEICETFEKVVFFINPWRGYSEQKNFGNEKARGSYIFSIDADEEADENLKRSIKSLNLGEKKAFFVRRRTNYCGQWIQYSGWQNDFQLRIFPKNSGSWSENKVHEFFRMSSEVPKEKIQGLLNHYSYPNMSLHIKKTIFYAKLSSQQLEGRSQSEMRFKSIFNPPMRFLKHYILKLGFLDGYRGFCISVITAMGNFLKYSLAASKSTRIDL